MYITGTKLLNLLMMRLAHYIQFYYGVSTTLTTYSLSSTLSEEQIPQKYLYSP